MNQNDLSDSWEDVLEAEPGKVLYEDAAEGCRFLIMRGPASLCAYVGVPESHPLAGYNYDDVPLRVHGGLTFSDKGGGTFPEGWWWYGWDYAHCDDYAVYYDKYPTELSPRERRDKKWTVREVYNDSYWEGWSSFQYLAKLAQKLYEKGVIDRTKEFSRGVK